MKRMKKLCALILALAFLMAALPVFPVGAEIVRSGKCGDNLRWTLDDEGTLTIRGQGEMEDYSFSYSWNGIEISKVVIEDGVTGIGDSAFSNCTSLTSITIPDSVTSIGERAFYYTGYYNDETNWENGVLYIGKHLIEADYSITDNCIIKAGTRIIADSAFSSHYSLTSIVIPDSVTSIGTNAFSSTGYYDDETNWENDMLYIGDHLIEVREDFIGNCVVRPGTRSIAAGAFSGCRSVTGVTIPQGVVTIGDNTFYGCSSLKSIVIPEGVTSIGTYAFSNCYELTSVTLPDGVARIGENAFEYCTALASVTLPYGVRNIEGYTFQHCSSLTSVAIPASVQSIGETAFSFTGLTSVSIPGSAKNMGEYAFRNCPDLESVTVGQGVTGLPEGVFSGCAALKSVALPEGLTNIGIRAFYGCQSLISVTIPASVDTIDNGALGYGDSWGTATPVQGFTIIGTPGTAAEAYADGNGFTFLSAGEGSLAGQIAQAQEQITSGLYTPESVAVLQTAIQEAQAVLSDENATQEEIDARMAALQAAISGLELLYSDVIWGDVNDEDGVTSSDALTVLQFATGKITLDEKQKVAANVDGKGDVTSADALMVLQYATQKITSFPVAG